MPRTMYVVAESYDDAIEQLAARTEVNTVQEAEALREEILPTVNKPLAIFTFVLNQLDAFVRSE